MNSSVDLELIIGYLRAEQVINSLHWANLAGYLYHYVTTLDDEVRYIWPKSFTLGKALYIVTRYSPIALSGVTIARAHAPMIHFYKGPGGTVCDVLATVQSVTSFIVSASADAAMVLCLYALMGASRRYMSLLALTYTAFILPAFVLNCMQLRYNPTVIQDPILEQLGAVCEVQQSPGVAYSTAVLSLYLTETVVFMVIWTIVLVRRYRCQNNSLICAIRRDGGTFYGTAFMVRIMYAVFVIMWDKKAGYALQDKIMASTFENLDTFFVPILATTLIMNLRRIDNPSSKAIVSALVFAVDQDLAALNDDGHIAFV